MRVVLLGTGGYHPSEERHTACIMLPEAGLVLDAGTGAFRIPQHLATRELDVFLSHAHLDHVVGLTYLLAPLALKQLDAVRVHATDVVLKALREHLFSAPLFPVMPAFDLRPLTGSSVELAGLRVRWQVLAGHPGSSMAYRIESTAGPAKSLAYVTDTVADGTYREFVRDADVLIHECYFPDALEEWAVKTGHSTTSKVLELARAANVGRLVLVHVDPRSSGPDPLGLAGVQQVFTRVEVARDGLEIDF
ncbi:Ribonuclease BN [Caulifigura coniformis]|uniref:Ribonuclease BN n=1 Tax=Caulifigura coniformis TaxID=2527983 RepID=A0A517SCY6_9PLAN|nr:MBL fold metallo-hydrolase [Caulifigura coniformis]QDT53992.1 Ribonuclease BN [Caulifigura coniformis]